MASVLQTAFPDAIGRIQRVDSGETGVSTSEAATEAANAGREKAGRGTAKAGTAEASGRVKAQLLNRRT
jgi:hypothetical protein